MSMALVCCEVKKMTEFWKAALCGLSGVAK